MSNQQMTMSRRGFAGLAALSAVAAGCMNLLGGLAPQGAASAAMADEAGWVELFTECRPSALTEAVYVDGAGSFLMGGQEYRGVTMLKERGDLEAVVTFDLKGAYDIISFDLGNVDGAADELADVWFVVDGEELESPVFGAITLPYPLPVEVPVNGARKLEIHANSRQVNSNYVRTGNVSIGIGNIRGHRIDGAGAAPAAAQVPDGTYSATVDDGGKTVTVSVTISGGLMAGMEFDSASGSASLAATVTALSKILAENAEGAAAGTEADPAAETTDTAE